MADDNHDLTGGWLMDAYSKALYPLQYSINTAQDIGTALARPFHNMAAVYSAVPERVAAGNPWSPDTDFSQFLGKPIGSIAPVSEDPFERAAQRTQQSVRMRRAQGRATLLPEILGAAIVPGFKNAIIDAATLPRDVYRGTIDPMSEEGIQRATNFALTAGMANAPFVGAAERTGAAGTFGGRLPPKKPPGSSTELTTGNLPTKFKEPETPSMPRLPTKEEAEAFLQSKLPATAEAQLPVTVEPESPLAAALQQPVSRRSFLQTAAKVPVVASRVKNIGDVLETLGKEPAAQPIAAALPKLNVIEKKGMFGYDEVSDIVDKIADERGFYDDLKEHYKDEYNYDVDAEKDLTTGEHNRHHQNAYGYDEISMLEGLDDEAQTELRKKHVMHEDELEHHPILPGADDSLRETLIQHNPELKPVENVTDKWTVKEYDDKRWEINNSKGGVVSHEMKKKYPSSVDALQAAKEQYGKHGPGIVSNKFYGSHDEPNVLMSYKTTDRNIEGANTLHGEEFKSDWHDAGKQRGYGQLTPQPITVEKGSNVGYWTAKRGDQVISFIYPNEAKTDAQALALANKKWGSKTFAAEQQPVPDAPYKDNWHEVAFDHFLSKAIKEGKDAVSWTKGEISPSITDRSSGFPVEKEVTHIGGSSDTAIIHDQKLVDYANKIGQKFGSKVETKNLTTLDETRPEDVPVHFMRITPQMRGSRGGGGGGGTVLREDTSPVAPLIVGTYYSPLEKHVVNHPAQSAPANQWAATLENAPIKREELADNGVINWLKAQGDRPVTRQALTEKIREGTPKIKVVEKSGAGWREEELGEAAYNHASEIAARRMREEYPNIEDTDPSYYDHFGAFRDEEFERQRSIIQQEAGTARYHPESEEGENLSLSGGDKNYRETLLKLPNPSWYYEGRTDAPSQAAQRQIYRSSHWDEPNVIAHYRANDRIIGNKKSLHLEEVQSDWHQQGRKGGYESKSPIELVLEGNGPWVIRTKEGRFIEDFNNKQKAEEALEGYRNGTYNPDAMGVKGVPDAPFKKSWHELALKHALKKAVDEGYDAISWTPGEAQAERYNLAQHVSDIQYDERSGAFLAHGRGQGVVSRTNIKPEDLPALIGKEVTNKLLNEGKVSDGNWTHKLAGQDLTIGGSGMRGFYDKIMVDTANRLGKRYGAKVEQRDLNASGNEPQPVHFMRITPEMREAVGSRGVSLYEDTSPEAPLAAVGVSRNDRVKQLIQQGNSYGEIASKLNMSRSAVAGVVDRLRRSGQSVQSPLSRASPILPLSRAPPTLPRLQFLEREMPSEVEPNLTGKASSLATRWTPEEDAVIRQMHAENRVPSTLSAGYPDELPGRTGRAIQKRLVELGLEGGGTGRLPGQKTADLNKFWNNNLNDIMELKQQGMSLADIARKYDVSYGALRQKLYKTRGGGSTLLEDTSPVAPLAASTSRRHPITSTASLKVQDLFDRHITPHMDEHEFARRYLSGMYDTNMMVNTFDSSMQGEALQIDGRLVSSPDIEARFGVPVGTELGYIQRHFYPDAGTAYHELLVLGKPYQGMGIGRQILADQVGVYGDLGFNKVKLLANKSAGSYSWAKYGFLPTESEWGKLATQLKRYITQGKIPGLDPPTRQMLMYMLEEKDPKTLWAISDMTDNPTGAKNGELGKRVLANQDRTMKAWNGVLNLNDAAQMERFHDYVGKIKP